MGHSDWRCARLGCYVNRIAAAWARRERGGNVLLVLVYRRRVDVNHAAASRGDHLRAGRGQPSAVLSSPGCSMNAAV